MSGLESFLGVDSIAAFVEPTGGAESEAPPKITALPRCAMKAPMHQPSEITCFTCGRFLGNDRVLVARAIAMLIAQTSARTGVRVELASLLPDAQVEIGDLLDALGYPAMCCRGHLLSAPEHMGRDPAQR